MDSEKKIAWRVEPNNGPNWDGYATYVNPILSQFSKDFGLTFKGNYSGDCPLWISKIPNVILKHLPISNTSNYLPHAGLCMFLSIGRYVYGNKLTDGKTPIYLACEVGNSKIVDYLLKNGAKKQY